MRVIILVASWVCLCVSQVQQIPLGLDAYLPVPNDNRLSSEKIEQGRRLFNDRRLSRDGSIACSTCHDPARRSRTAARKLSD